MVCSDPLTRQFNNPINILLINPNVLYHILFTEYLSMCKISKPGFLMKLAISFFLAKFARFNLKAKISAVNLLNSEYYFIVMISNFLSIVWINLHFSNDAFQLYYDLFQVN